MTGKQDSTSFSDSEMLLVKAVAEERGISIDEAAAQLVSEGLANRVQKNTGRRPSASVLRFRRGH